MAEMFCSINDVNDFLQVEVDEPSAMRAIAEATAAIKAYCNQQIELVTNDAVTLDGPGGQWLFLPELPVVTVSSVTEDGTALLSTDYTLTRYGVLQRNGGVWSKSVAGIVVVYTHGYAVIPGVIRDVATRMAARAYQAGLKAAETLAVPGIAATSLGDYSVTFTEGGGGAGEGLLGASGARILLQSEKELLARYRVTRC